MVGHADEVLTFVPWAGSRLGFKLLLASPALACQLLATCGDAAMNVPAAFVGPKTEDAGIEGPLTAAALLGSPRIRDATEIASKFLAEIRATLMVGLRLEETDVVDLPVLYYTYDASKDEQKPVLKGFGSSSSGELRKGVAAFIPNAVNMLVATKDDGTATLCVPKPYGPPGPHGPCAFEAEVTRLLTGSGDTVVFIDNFAALHVKVGEIHCGTYEVRRPGRHMPASCVEPPS